MARLETPPPIESSADLEWQTRIEADQCALQFADLIRPAGPVLAWEDLPLFGGERQQELF